MANGASRVFEIFKNTSENVVGNENQFVSLSVKTLEPLTFTLDDKVTITKDLYILDVNFSIENLQVNDTVNALLLNKGQVFYILGNTNYSSDIEDIETNIQNIDETINDIQSDISDIKDDIEDLQIVSDYKQFVHNGVNWEKAGTYTQDEYLVSLDLVPKKSGNYLVNINLPVVCIGGTAFVVLIKDGGLVQNFSVPAYEGKSMCSVSQIINGLTLNEHHFIQLAVIINNATNYTIINFMPVSFTAVEI